MIDALTWWLAIEVVGLIAFPIAFVALRFLADRGYSFSKIIGLLLTTYILWLGANLHIVPNRRLSLLLILVLLAAVSGALARRRRSEIASFLRERWHHLLAIELIVTAIFALGVFLHSYSADITYAGSEKPTDNAILNAVMRAEYFPPEDPWLAGFDVNYYYFGHTSVATVAEVTDIPSSTAFNLGMPFLVALAGSGIVGIIYTLLIDRTRLRYVLLFGTLGVALFTVLSNLEGVLELLAAHGFGSRGFYGWFHITGLDGPQTSSEWYPTEPFWWARAYTFDFWPAQLFPFPRLRFGEMRPEIMSFPFSVLVIGVALNLWRSPRLIGDGDWWRRGDFLLPALAVGAVAAVHTWDAPTFFLILVAAVGLRNYLLEGWLSAGSVARATGVAGGTLLLAVLLYLPFYRTDFGSFGGLELLEASGASRPQHLFLMWLPLLWLAGSLAVAAAGGLRRSRSLVLIAMTPIAAVAGLWGLAFVFQHDLSGLIDELGNRGFRWLSALALASVLLVTLLALLRQLRRKDGDGRGEAVFPLALIATGVMVLFGIEFFWVEDPGSWLPRFNTSIRANMQVWLLLSVGGGGFGLYYVITTWKPQTRLAALARGAWAAATVALLLGGFTYPLLATVSTTDTFANQRYLDGLYVMAQAHPGEHEAILWLRDDVPGTPVILEAVDLSYTPYSRVSTFTGLPTVLGWDQHEYWWRGGSWEPQGNRRADIESMYNTPDPAEAERLLRQYDVEYVYVGWLEREKYPEADIEKFHAFMDVAFQNGEVTIFQMPAGAGDAAVSDR